MNDLKFNQWQPSAFAQIVDKLRSKSEAELKILYVRFFKKELQNQWKAITKEGNLKKISEADLIKAIQKNRYRI